MGPMMRARWCCCCCTWVMRIDWKSSITEKESHEMQQQTRAFQIVCWAGRLCPILPLERGRGHTKFAARDATRHYKVIKREHGHTKRYQNKPGTGSKTRWDGQKVGWISVEQWDRCISDCATSLIGQRVG